MYNNFSLFMKVVFIHFKHEKLFLPDNYPLLLQITQSPV